MIILWFDIAVRRDEVAQMGIRPSGEFRAVSRNRRANRTNYKRLIPRVGFRGRQLGSVGNGINVKFSNAPINEASLFVGRKSQVPRHFQSA
jgi:hypothetical protein